jgi:hypothetical protein
MSIGLHGSYIERTPWPGALLYSTNGLGDSRLERCPHPGNGTPIEEQRRFRAPFINRHQAEDLHVLDVEAGPVWTLFLTRPKTRSWGFAGPFGWLGWRDFDERYPEREAYTTRLDGPERRVLEALVDVWPDDLSKQDLGERAGYTVGPKVGGAYGNILGRLRSLGLIEYPAQGRAVAADILFLGGGRG